MKKLLHHLPLLLLVFFVILLFKDFFIFQKIPLPGDTLIGAYFPWLDYKWGFPTGVPVQNPITSDAFSQFFVWKKVFVDTVLQGQIPLWNSTSLSGSPLMASFHSSVFNPANILLFIPNVGWGLYIFSSVLFASLSMFLYLSLWTKDKGAASIASVVYALAGPMSTWAEFGTAVFAAAFFPLIFFFLHIFVLNPQKKSALMLSVPVALLIFSGHVQLLTYTLILIPFYLLYLYKGAKASISPILKAIIFIGLGVLVGMVQLLPTKEFYSRSIRAEEHYSSTFNFGLTPISQMVRLWSADFFGHPTTRNFFSDISYHENSSFVGFLTVPFLIYLWLTKGDRKRLFLPTTILLLCFILAIDNPFSRLIFSAPIPLLTYSSASRLFFLTNFSTAILLAISLEEVFRSKSRTPLFLVLALILITVLVTFLVPVDHRSVSQKNIILPIAIGISFVIGWIFFRHHKTIFFIIIFSLFSLDLGRYFLKYNTFFPIKNTFPSTPVFEFISRDKSVFRIARQDTNLLTPNTWSYYGLESIEGYDPLYSSDYAHFFNLISGNPYHNGVSRYAILGTYDSRFLDSLNVKYYISVNPKEKIGWKNVFTDKTVSVYQNPNVLPRAYFAKKTTILKDQKDLILAIDSNTFDPRSDALILDNPINKLTYDPDSQVKIVKYSSQEMILETMTQQPSFLVISNSYDPGWRISINGKDSKIYKTNTALIGVEVGKGESIVKLTYLPTTFLVGALISIVSIILILISLKFV